MHWNHGSITWKKLLVVSLTQSSMGTLRPYVYETSFSEFVNHFF